MMMKHPLLTFLTFCTLGITATAQNKSFTVAAMNVDGMPKSIKVAGIYTVNLNPDAKEAAGATAIGQKLVTKGYDYIAVSEDFNYNDQIMEQIGGTYAAGTHRGKITASLAAIANYLAKKPLFDTDGLNLFWRKDAVGVNAEYWTAWNDHHGYDNDGADGLIKKGFRYYLADLGNGQLVDLYILHMDAEVSNGDLAARESQLRQLADDILRINPSRRPKIVMGDTNCRYTRDHLKALFIDVINADPRYTIKDGWVEKCKNNTYPAYGSNALMVDALGYVEGEIVDKLFYINPKYGMQLTLNSFFVDTDFNGADGEPLADHYPVVGKFVAKGTLYDPATYWSGSYDNDAYRAYAQAYEALLPLTRATLKSPLKEELAALLTEHVDAASDITARFAAFRQHLKENMAENYTEDEQTSKLANPSFEQGQRLASGHVEGWTVNPEATEAFISGVVNNDEGAAVRDFTLRDGNYIFNTWGGRPAAGFYCRQEVTLNAGWYRLEGTIATDSGFTTSLRFGDARLSSGPRYDRHAGCRLELITYHPGGKVIIGAESADWFEADDFRLYRYKAIPTAIESIEADNPSTLRSAQRDAPHLENPHPSTIYDLSGRRLSYPRPGLNIIRNANGTTQKVLIK